MARIRTIKPGFWRHEDLSELPEATHLLAASLLNYADDDGYFNANPRLIRAECCPLREPSVSIPDSLNQLSSIGYLRLGIGDDGKRYGQIVKFAEHQKINRPTGSKIKMIRMVWDGSPTPHQQFTEPSLPEGNGREEEGKGDPPPPQTSGGSLSPDDGFEVPANLDRRRYSEAFEEVWQAYRPIASKNATKADASAAFVNLSKPDQKVCLVGVKAYAAWFLDERKRTPDAQSKHLATFIEKRGWEPFLEGVSTATVPQIWIDCEDPQWAVADFKCRQVKGRPLLAHGSQHGNGQGAFVPVEWLGGLQQVILDKHGALI